MSEEETGAAPATPGLISPGRLFGLADGVFAISITLLALDVRIPDDLPSTAEGFIEGRGELYGHYGVFILAFWITSRFWLANHRMMANVHHVDRELLSRAVMFLAGISSLPVATAVLVRYGSVPEAVTFASVLLAVTWVMSARLWWYLSDPARGLSDDDPRTRLNGLLDALYNAGVFLLAIPIAYGLEAFTDIHPAWAMLAWVSLRLDKPFIRLVNKVLDREGVSRFRRPRG